MTYPEWLKPGVYGALIGAVSITIAGFSWGGWVTGGHAEAMASTRSHDELIAALVPVCVNMAKTDTDRIAKLASIQETMSFKRRDAVIATGWATIPGAETPNRDLAQACLAGLELDAS
ncbi:hypothetical protein D1822_08765 [Phaeobacter inhibens]|uniref:hypothetical protein n=1 Tax=Phaeobacter inhibens TaxID=221822 RepID=UPI0001632C6E|nr:hypothetical protein [Phaeobacter inhibens]AFO91464.1 hypothetical protein PGA1_c17640 [Phaeobacter inhibens DSM 17395]AUQ46128.1 hypothetical protein PhaeoP10_01790 [Phaeobacter inhibens]AXT22912.1 hypothetical protein D1822_08765 [Phaeobacter inhibens]